ncbi:MAG: hypothetical protein PHU61_00350 [Candidatus Absconditabacteria bacterium]|nr:hypothetical protein [Candidatus Absconditabacteria bacterium]MDD3868621.1 hypothetical protein [Candidatus Absconditabacteria bacterium]MDD4714141.1 hypothetical protein [Candidatus Absconditabacteria bacterium]
MKKLKPTHILRISLGIVIGIVIGIFWSGVLFYQNLTTQAEEIGEENTFQSIEELSKTFPHAKIGSIIQNPEIIVYAEVEGKIEYVRIQEGTAIKNGQPVINIAENNKQYSSTLEQGEEQSHLISQELALHEQNSKRTEELGEQEIALLTLELKNAEQELANLLNEKENNRKEEQNNKELLLGSSSNEKEKLITLVKQTQETINKLINANQFYGIQSQNKEAILKTNEELKRYLTTIQTLSHSEENALLQQYYQKLFEGYQQVENILETNKLILYQSSEITELEEFISEIIIEIRLLQRQKENFLLLYQKSLTLTQVKSDEELQAEELWYQTQTQNKEQEIYTIENLLEKKKIEYELLLNTNSAKQQQLQHELELQRLTYEKAYNLYNKLTARASSDGIIKEILVEEGQEIYTGTPLFSIQKNHSPTIKVNLSLEEFLLVEPEEEILIYDGSNAHSGVLLTKSPIANEQGIYSLEIELLEETQMEYSVASVIFSLNTDNIFLPKESITNISETKGKLLIQSETNTEEREIELGRTRNDWKEIKTQLPREAMVQIIESSDKINF